MRAWLFQGNPDRFDIDGYLGAHDEVTWTVLQKHLIPEIELGDRVFFWRSKGTHGDRDYGVVGVGKITSLPELRVDDPNSEPFWRDKSEEPKSEAQRCVVQVDRESLGRLLSVETIRSSPELANLRVMAMRNETNYRLEQHEAEGLERLFRSAGNEVPVAWLCLTVAPDQRQHAGNLGYRDEIEQVYPFDTTVSNARRVRQGDVVLLHSPEQFLGAAWIRRLVEGPGTKTRQSCPSCGKTTIKPRKKTPRYRCYECKVEFDEPSEQEIAVTQFAARFEGSFTEAREAIPLRTLRAACPKANTNHSIQQIDLNQIAGALPTGLKPLLSRATRTTPVSGLRKILVDSVSGAAEVLSVSGDFDAKNDRDGREKTLRAIALRLGQPQFRAKLLSVYGARCCVTGCDVAEALEAAHILPYRGEETHHVQNGLLLRADLHTLFDRGLLAFSASLTVLLSATLRGTHYEALAGTTLRLPANPAEHPSAKALSRHRQEMFLEA